MNNIEREEEFSIGFSIFHKIMIYALLLVFIATGLSTYLAVRTESEVLTREMIHFGHHMARGLASSVESAFWSLNWIYIESQLQESVSCESSEIIYARIVKPDGEIYLADNEEYYGEMVDPSLLSDRETLIEDYYFSEKEEYGMLLIHPTVIGDEKWYVHLGLSLSSIKEATRALIIRNLKLMVLIISLGTAGSFVFSKMISNPINKLARAVKTISSGQWDYNVEVKTKDEVGLLNNSFKQMIRNLKSAQEELKESEIRYKTLIESAAKANMGIIVFQQKGREKGIINFVNKGITKISGYGKDELLRMTIQDIMAAEDYKQFFNNSAKEESDYRTLTLSRCNIINNKEEKISVEISTGITGFEGKKAVVCYLTEITEKLKIEQQLQNYSQNLEKMVEERTRELKKTLHDLQVTQSQLIQSEKMASVGQLSAGIAHEINTPTQYVSDNTHFIEESFTEILELLKKYQQLLAADKEEHVSSEMIDELKNASAEIDIEYLSEEIPRAIEQSLEGLHRVSEIVCAMKDFSHPGGKEKTAIDINKAINNTLMVTHNEWKYVADMQTDLDPEMPSVLCLSNELNQVFLNMIVNAVHAISDVVGDALDDKGKIRISTRREGEWAEIRISDTGTGIPEDIRTKIFDPFFTTKKLGMGTGQGLAIAYSIIVENHKGTIDFETETGKGTTFIIRLPLGDHTS